jgi:hypothetical protein
MNATRRMVVVRTNIFVPVVKSYSGILFLSTDVFQNTIRGKRYLFALAEKSGSRRMANIAILFPLLLSQTRGR